MITFLFHEGSNFLFTIGSLYALCQVRMCVLCKAGWREHTRVCKTEK